MTNNQLEKELNDSFRRWAHIIKNGAGDPHWPDGTNLNLIRNHIIYYKRKCAENNFFPEAYYIELPPEVPSDYMIKKLVFEANEKNQLTLFGIMQG